MVDLNSVLPSPGFGYSPKSTIEGKLIVGGGGLEQPIDPELFISFEYRAMLSDGYIVHVEINDPGFVIYNQLIQIGYHSSVREMPIVFKFKIVNNNDGGVNGVSNDTKEQTAIIVALKTITGTNDSASYKFIAIDPPSWYLNVGDGNGGVFTGKVSDVIREVCEKYAPNVQVDVSDTIDSDRNKWWMMRLDPKTFIMSLLDWSSSITKKKSQWIVASDGYKLRIKEQAGIPSKNVRVYDRRNIINIEIASDNSLSIVQTNLLTQGASSVSGSYLDRITDNDRNTVYVNDSNTSSKKIARTESGRSFDKPPDNGDPPIVGKTTIQGIPEIYSAGDIGLRYEEYVDGRPRGMWLDLANALIRMKLKVLGDGKWFDSMNLGVDTIYISWGIDTGKFWWATGYWLVYGFHHRLTRQRWTTEIYCARFDHDSMADKVGKVDY